MILQVIKIFLFFITLLCCCHAFSQSHVYKHYGVEDGLPSSEVYYAFQDSKGYIWFATDAGVSRFNGYEFENFDSNEGLMDNTVFKITEDYRGRIWFGTFNCQLSYFENDSIFPYWNNSNLSKVLKGNSAMTSFHVDSTDNVWIGFKLYGIYKSKKNGEVVQIINSREDVNCQFKYIQFKEAFIFGYLVGGAQYENVRMNVKKFHYNIIGDIQHQEKLDINLDIIWDDRDLNFHINSFQEGYLITKNPSFFINKQNGNVRLKEVSPPIFIRDVIYSVFIDDDFIWYTTDKGAYKCKLINDEVIVIQKYFEGKSISSVFKDNENGYWFQTLMDGVYYLSAEELRYSKTENPITAIEIDTNKGQLYMAYNDGRVVKEKGSFHFETIAEQEKTSLTLDYNYSEQSLLIGGTDGHFSFYKNDQITSIKEVRGMQVKSFLVDKNLIYRVNGLGLSIIENEQEIYNSFYTGSPRMWCTSLLKNGEDIWIGTKEGIRIYNDKNISKPFNDNDYLSSAITCMERFDENTILVGTKNFGLLVLQNDSIIEKLNVENGLMTDLINSIHVANDKSIWIGSNNGLTKVIYSHSGNHMIQNLTKYHGFATGEINDICSYKNTIYAASSTGLYKFDRDVFQTNKNPPSLSITHIFINSSERSMQDAAILSHEENYIKIGYEAINFRSLGEVEYQYRMLGVDTNWIFTKSLSVQYPMLGPNDYRFEVKAKNEDGIWTTSPASLSFSIKPPFWLTWWFISLEILFGIGVIFGIIWYREKQIKGKSEIEKKMIELELKALRSQMNPHFIFNTLNSIQHYIAVNDFKSTNKYIVQFATLIRTILHISEKNVITIQEEIDILTMYMDLEKMRFEEQFDYKIEVSDEIDKDYDEIPSMLLQPYVENAIWHGLMNKKGKGEIKIGIVEEGEYLCCSIEDNGIGRKKAAEIKEKRNIHQKSVGMTVTKERLDLISNNEVNVSTVDLYDEKGEVAGTRMLVRVKYKS